MAEITVKTQSTQRRGKSERWAYVIDRDGFWPFVSSCRFGSEATARAAGEADAARLAAYLATTTESQS